MEFEPEIGSIIEFDDGDDHQLAIVTDTIGKKKLALLTAGGDQMRTTRSDITYMLGAGSTQDLDRAESKLAALDTTIEGRRGDVDLEMLWEFVREDDQPMSPKSLAELMFADTSDESILAVLRALRANPIYFKSRRDGDFEPRADGQVASLKRQREARLEKQRQHQRVLNAIASVLERPREERADHMEELLGEHDALRNAIYLLQDFAAHGEHFTRRDEAEAILDDLLDLIDERLDGHMDQKAFFLMRKLELWDEHYNTCLHRFRIDAEHPPEVVERAKALSEQVWEPEGWRRDLTGWTTVTVDSASSRDLDDALSCRPTIDGGWELAIHIADPAAYIDTASMLDRDAQGRGTSIYLPTGNIPMFPRAFSEGRMSLLPEQLRPAMTTLVIFDENLEITDSEVFPSVIRVDRRFSYDEVDALLQGEETGRFPELFQCLEFIASQCHSERTENGGVYFDLPDRHIVVDRSDGSLQVSVKAVDTDTPSRALVSELMILNNELVGRFCARHELPAIYRNQEPPEQALIDDEILAIPEGVARTFAQIRRMKPGTISSQPGPHFGLGIHSYAQASSPIRRYPDLVCQRQIKAFFNDDPLPYDEASILEVLANCEQAISEASTTQRDTERYWLLYYLAHYDGPPLEAVVVEHYDGRGNRASVFLVDCAYRSSCSLRTKVPVGERLEVVVERADPRRDVLSLRQAPQPSS